MITTRIDLLRHGEVQGGAYFRGSTDDPLTLLGWQQMHQTVSERHDWDVIISSPLSRCLDFAKQMSEQRQLPLTVFPEISEINFGHWEGKTADEIEQAEPGALERFYSDPDEYAPANGENFNAFSERISSAWHKLCDDNRGRRPLVITHAGMIRMVFSQVLEISIVNSFRIQVNHASLTRFQHIYTDSSGYYQLLFHKNP